MFYQLSKNDTEKPNILSDGTVNRPVQLERNEKRNANYTGCSASASGTLTKKKIKRRFDWPRYWCICMRCFQFLIPKRAFFFLPTFVFTSRWCKLSETGPFPRRSFQAVPNDLKRRPLWHARHAGKVHVRMKDWRNFYIFEGCVKSFENDE